jgi:tetratricopeptide (TPR) repeat protein
MALARQGAWEEATQTFEQALALARQIKYPYAQARALYQYGSMMMKQGDTVQALRLLQEALVIFQRLGARPYTERTERLLAALGNT